MRSMAPIVAAGVAALLLAGVSYPGLWSDDTTTTESTTGTTVTESTAGDSQQLTVGGAFPGVAVAASQSAQALHDQQVHEAVQRAQQRRAQLGAAVLAAPVMQLLNSDAVTYPGSPLVPYANDRRARVASLMVVGVNNYDDALFALQRGAGGIFIGSWTEPSLLTQPGRDIAALREAVGRPFHVTIDAEGGRVARQPDIFGTLPAPRDMAATMSPEEVEQLAFELGQRLHSRGVTIDFAPAVDTDDGDPFGAIGDRSFSGDPIVAGRYGTAFARGLEKAGVYATVKHFPGHGRATGDSHTGNVSTPPIEELKKTDLLAYNQPLKETDALVMVGHVTAVGLGPEGLPSTVNPEVYQMLRRGDWQDGVPFDGVIVTDDLSGMKAITDNFSLPDAVVGVLAAGADMPLWITTHGFDQVVDAVEAALDDGRLDERALNRSALRVARLLD